MSRYAVVRGRRYWFSLSLRNGFIEFGHRRLVWRIFTVPHEPPLDATASRGEGVSHVLRSLVRRLPPHGPRTATFEQVARPRYRWTWKGMVFDPDGAWMPAHICTPVPPETPR